MNKKILFPILIIALFIIGHLVNGLITFVYNDLDLLETFEGQLKLTVITSFVVFISSSVFHLIIIYHFDEMKYLRVFSASSIVIAFAFAGYVSFSQLYEFSTIIVRLYAGVTYFVSIFNIGFAITIILKEMHHKIVTNTLLYSAVVTFLFGTLVLDYIQGYIVSFFGLTSSQAKTAMMILGIFILALQFTIVILQAISIVILVEYKDSGKILYKRKRIEQSTI